MSKLQKISLGISIFALVFVGTFQVSKALTQADVDFICNIVDCSQSGIRAALENLIDDESDDLTRNLYTGISGDDVRKLQEFLASDKDVYPEGLITGYYGALTERAVKRFQEKWGIDSIGSVDELTRKALNKFLKEKKKGKKAFDDYEVDEDEDLDDDVSDDVPGMRGHKVVVCHNGKNIAVARPAVKAHLGHGDEIGKCDSSDDSDDDSDDSDDSDDDKKDAEEEIADAKEAISELEDGINDTDENDKDYDEAEELLERANNALDNAESALADEEYELAEKRAKNAENLAKKGLELLGLDDDDDEDEEDDEDEDEDDDDN
jgi:predicted HTH domain antitoxin